MEYTRELFVSYNSHDIAFSKLCLLCDKQVDKKLFRRLEPYKRLSLAPMIHFPSKIVKTMKLDI